MTAPAVARPVGPRRPALDRDTAMRLAATEYDRYAELLRELDGADWSAPTCCPGWDVRLMTCHVLGMAEFAASTREKVLQLRVARRHDGPMVDGLTALQVAKHAAKPPAELVAAVAAVGPRAVRGRRRMPGFVRGRAMPDEQPLDATGATTEPWTLGYLNDVIFTRDTWMHRSDVTTATGREMRLTADHDGVLVADVAEEWASRHGRPCRLALTGPAGGTWQWGEGGPAYELDAVEFCRIVAGRGAGEDLLATAVPF